MTVVSGPGIKPQSRFFLLPGGWCVHSHHCSTVGYVLISCNDTISIVTLFLSKHFSFSFLLRTLGFMLITQVTGERASERRAFSRQRLNPTFPRPRLSCWRTASFLPASPLPLALFPLVLPTPAPSPAALRPFPFPHPTPCLPPTGARCQVT